jgi:hypothetical protein
MASATKQTKNQQKRAKKKAQKESQVRHSIYTTIGGADRSQKKLADTPEAPGRENEAEPEQRQAPVPEKQHNGVTAEPMIVDEENPLYDLYKDVMG